MTTRAASDHALPNEHTKPACRVSCWVAICLWQHLSKESVRTWILDEKAATKGAEEPLMMTAQKGVDPCQKQLKIIAEKVGLAFSELVLTVPAGRGPSLASR